MYGLKYYRHFLGIRLYCVPIMPRLHISYERGIQLRSQRATWILVRNISVRCNTDLGCLIKNADAMSRRPCNRELHKPLCKQCGPIHWPSEGEHDSPDAESIMEGGTSFENNDDHQNVVDEQPHSGPQIASSISSSGQELHSAGPSSAGPSSAGPLSSRGPSNTGPQSSAPSQNSAVPLSSAGPSSAGPQSRAGPRSSAPLQSSTTGPQMNRQRGDPPQRSQPSRRAGTCSSTGEGFSEQRVYFDQQRGSCDRPREFCVRSGHQASAGLPSSTNRRHRIASETGASCPPLDGCDVARGQP